MARGVKGSSFGGVIKLTGASEYQRALNDIVGNLTLLSNELKLVETQYGKNDDSIDGLISKNYILKNKLDQLTEKYNSQKNVLELVRDKIAKNSEKHEELTKQLEKERLKLDQLKNSGNATTEQIDAQKKVVDELTGKLAKNESAQQTNITALQTTQSELLKTESEITSVNNEISKNTSKINENSSAYNQLKNKISDQEKELNKLKAQYKNVYLTQGKSSDEAKSLKNQIDKLNSELEDNKKTLDDAENSLGDYKNQTNETTKATSNFGSTLKAILVRDVLVGGLKALTNGIKQLASAMVDFAKKGVKNASDIQEYMNVVDVVFGDSAYQIEDFAKRAATAYGMTRQSALQYAGTMGAMLQSMGVTGEETLKMSTALAGLAGDMASFYNIAQETAWQKIRAGISGEVEPLKQLGINLSVANLEEFALAQGIRKTYNEMTQAEKATLRYDYLMNAAANSIGDFERTSGNFVNQQRIAKLQIENLATALGEQLLPTVNGVLTAFNQMLSGELTLEEGIKRMTTLVMDLANKLIANLPTITSAAVSMIGNLIEGINTALPLLVPIVLQVVNDLVNLLLSQLPQILVVGISVVNSLVSGIGQMLPSLIPAMVNVILTLVQTALDNIDSTVGAGMDLMVGLITGILNAIPLIVSKIPILIESLINGFIAFHERISSEGTSIISQLVFGLISAIPYILSNIPKIVGAILKGFFQLIIEAPKIGLNIIKGIIDGMFSGFSTMKNAISKIGNSVVGWFKSAFKINSPSKVFADEIGNNLGLGIEKGFVDTMGEAKKEMANSIPTDFNVSTNIRNSDRSAYTYDNLVSAFKEALRDVKVVMDGDQMGEFVINKVAKEVYN